MSIFELLWVGSLLKVFFEGVAALSSSRLKHFRSRSHCDSASHACDEGFLDMGVSLSECPVLNERDLVDR